MPKPEKNGLRFIPPDCLTDLWWDIYVYLVNEGALSPAKAIPREPIGEHTRNSGTSKARGNGINGTLTHMWEASVLARVGSATSGFRYYIPSPTDYLIALYDEDRNSND